MQNTDFMSGITQQTLRGQKTYDWVFGDPEHQVTPEASPYSFSPHYLFRNGKKTAMGISGTTAYPTDRMRLENPEKAGALLNALSLSTLMKTTEKAEIRRICIEAAKIYFGDDVTCLGFAVDCNRSSGYPFGIFFIKEGHAAA